MADITKGPIPDIADDSAVVFVSCVFEYVAELDAALREVSRIAGSPENVFVVTVQPWTLTARLYPGAHWRGTVSSAAGDQTVDMERVSLEEKLIVSGALGLALAAAFWPERRERPVLVRDAHAVQLGAGLAELIAQGPGLGAGELEGLLGGEVRHGRLCGCRRRGGPSCRRGDWSQRSEEVASVARWEGYCTKARDMPPSLNAPPRSLGVPWAIDARQWAESIPGVIRETDYSSLLGTQGG